MAVGALVGGGLFAAQFFNLVSIVPVTDPILLASIFIGGGLVVGLMVGAFVLSGLQARDKQMPTPVTAKHDEKSSRDIQHKPVKSTLLGQVENEYYHGFTVQEQESETNKDGLNP